LVTNYQDQTVSILLNTTAPGAASASFTSPPPIPIGTSPRSVATGDFNLDGRVDLATANQLADATSFRLNTPLGALQFESSATAAAENAPTGIVIVRDGGSYAGPAQVTVSATGGSATSGADYTGLPGSVSFPNGDVAPRNAPVTIQNDGVLEHTETINLSIGSPSPGLGLGPRTASVHSIIDAQCNPRPSPTVSVSSLSSTAVKANLKAGLGGLTAVRFGDVNQNPALPTNVSVDIAGGPSGITGAFTYTPPPNTSEVDLTLNRISSGAGVMVPMVLTDNCGDWTTFAGAGAGAFPPLGPAQADVRGAARTGATSPAGDACAAFPSQSDAQAFLRDNPTDPRRMDTSRNGIACEVADGRNALPGPKDLRPVPRR
jgi:hypothetical protein